MFSWLPVDILRRADDVPRWSPLSSKAFDRRASPVPTPIAILPSQSWDGNDGPWSSFFLRVGNPPQSANVFISTAGDQTWVIRNPDGCSRTPNPSQCFNSRGSLFSANRSTTWVQNNFTSNGVFNVGLESNLNYTASARFGYDTVALGVLGSGGPSLDQQVVAAMADYPFWLGNFGVHPAASNFTDLNHPIPSYMTSLRSSGLIPSTSYGYTAGNEYRLNGVFGSLTLGGFDASKFVPNNLTWTFKDDVSRDLVVNVASISMSTGSSNITLSNESFPAFIDSTVPYFYLPADACRQFEQAFGLTYDKKSQLYLVNDTLRARLLAQAPTVTFSLANLTSPDWVNITLPYDAFDLTAGWPLVTNETAYFPLKEAADNTQTTLGRAFLQEAYLIADYERSNFSVSSCAWNADAKQDLRTILPPPSTVPASNGSTATQFPIGAAVGAAVGGLVLIAIALGVYLFIRRRRGMQAKEPTSAERRDDEPLFPRAELDATETAVELAAKPIQYIELEEQCRTQFLTDEVTPTDDITVAPSKKGQLVGDSLRPPPDKTLRPTELEASDHRAARASPSEKFDTFTDTRKYRF